MNVSRFDLKTMKKDAMNHIFDLETHPIDDLSNPAASKLVARCQKIWKLWAVRLSVAW